MIYSHVSLALVIKEVTPEPSGARNDVNYF